MDDLTEVAVGFGRHLRARSLDAPVSSVVCFGRALVLLGLGDPVKVFWAGHASFVRRPEQSRAYAEAFASYFGELASGVERGDALPVVVRLADASGPEGDGASDERETHGVPVLSYSSVETLSEKDFAQCTEEETAVVRSLISSMRRSAPFRAARRKVPVEGTKGSPDLRRTVRRALRSGGEPLRLSRLGHGQEPRAVVLLVDVSGSMDAYSRSFLFLAHALVVGGRHVEAFALGTRLTRVTRELSWRDADAAVALASASISDISGGTRLGEGLKVFNDRFGVVGMARGAVVVVLSDGWDRGDPAQIGREMERLHRVAHKVIWANPLKASPGYEPLARGMAAALPHLDLFVEGNTLGSLERLVDQIAS